MAVGTTPVDLDRAVFISYAHVDNEPFGPEEQHWVSYLHEQLTSRLTQLFGGDVAVWRDDKLQGNDVFAETLTERLSTVAALVAICSPRYIRSEWCRRELETFLRSAGDDVGAQVGTKSRIFKVLKTPVPRTELPETLEELLGYEFFEFTSSDRIREFLINPDPDERLKFYLVLDDLAQDIAGLLRDLSAEMAPEESPTAGERSSRGTVFLAESTSDVRDERDNLRRELERQGFEVLPNRTLPLTIEELTSSVQDDLSRTDVSVHLLGARYGSRPEGDDRSIPHVQIELARETVADGRLTQLVWVPDLFDEPQEETQSRWLDDLQRQHVGPEAELVRSSLESFKSYLLDRLTSVVSAPEPASVEPGAKHVYLVYDAVDADAAASVRSALEAAGHVVLVPLGEGSETEAREIHENSMVFSDAVLIYYGDVSEHWIRMKLFDLVKAKGWNRTEPFLARAVWVADPSSAYSTNEALVLHRGRDQPIGDTLRPFLARLDSTASQAVPS